MKNKIKVYVVSKLPNNRKAPGYSGEAVWYCHMRGFPGVPVFGSIGTKAKAQRVCDEKNGAPKGERKRKR